MKYVTYKLTRQLFGEFLIIRTSNNLLMDGGKSNTIAKSFHSYFIPYCLSL